MVSPLILKRLAKVYAKRERGVLPYLNLVLLVSLLLIRFEKFNCMRHRVREVKGAIISAANFREQLESIEVWIVEFSVGGHVVRVSRAGVEKLLCDIANAPVMRHLEQVNVQSLAILQQPCLFQAR